MARQPSPTVRVTVYQLESELAASAAIRDTYLDREGFAQFGVSVAGRAGILVRGMIVRDSASWAPVVAGWIDDVTPVAGLGNATAAAALLLPTSKQNSIWAITFGMGFQLLEPSRIVPGLGRRLAVRCADPEHLRSITHTRLDARAFVARTSIPGGDALDGFGAGDIGDLVSRVVGPAGLQGLLAADRNSASDIRGADAINLPLARDPERLLADLVALEALLDREPLPGLALIEQLQALRSSDPRISGLEAALDDALGREADPALGLAWPTELADEAVPLSHFNILGLPRDFDASLLPEGPQLESVLLPLVGLPAGERLTRLDRMRVQAFSDDDEPASNLLPARRWISFETILQGQRFCLHDGRWYSIDSGLAERVAARADAVFRAPSPLLALPDWPADSDEAHYNRMLATALGGVCLDRQLVRCESHPRGFEACDVLTPDGALVHVKGFDRSAPASHLFAQAGVSTQAVLQDATARARLRDLIAEAGGDPGWLPDRVQDVVLVMGNQQSITAETLPSFARMRLVRLADECRLQAVHLAVSAVVRA